MFWIWAESELQQIIRSTINTIKTAENKNLYA